MKNKKMLALSTNSISNPVYLAQSAKNKSLNPNGGNTLTHSGYNPGFYIPLNLVKSSSTGKVSFQGLSRNEQIAHEVAKVLYNYRKNLGECENKDADGSCPACTGTIEGQLLSFINNNEPIQFMLPAFPFKSPSPEKCLGKHPDMAEEQSLNYLKKVCDEIQEQYTPGAKINIFTDGRVFAGVSYGVTDEDVTRYTKSLREMISDVEASNQINIVTLEDVYGNLNHKAAREKLINEYGSILDVIEQRVQEDGLLRNKYTGIKKFVEEEYKVTRPDLGTNARRREAKKEALKTIQAAEAWSSYIKAKMPEAIRLSSHPQSCGASRFGIYLSENAEDWMNPWNGCAVEMPDGKYILAKRGTAERCGLKLVKCTQKGLPSHFKCDDTTSQAVIDKLRQKNLLLD